MIAESVVDFYKLYILHLIQTRMCVTIWRKNDEFILNNSKSILKLFNHNQSGNAEINKHYS